MTNPPPRLLTQVLTHTTRVRPPDVARSQHPTPPTSRRKRQSHAHISSNESSSSPPSAITVPMISGWPSANAAHARPRGVSSVGDERNAASPSEARAGVDATVFHRRGRGGDAQLVVPLRCGRHPMLLRLDVVARRHAIAVFRRRTNAPRRATAPPRPTGRAAACSS